MKVPADYPWADTAEEAIALQQSLRQQVITTDQVGSVGLVAGVDVGFEDGGETTRAAVAVLSFPDLQLQEQVLARRPTSFPYIPGLLSFREIPTVLDALEKLQSTPDLLLCDGQGIAHPRRFGIASHLGVIINWPTIGVGKSLLVGKHDEVPNEKGEWRSLQHKGETIGAVLRTRTGTKPLYISSGHRVGLSTAIDYVLRCTTKYRLPETTRFADKLASDKSGSVNPVAFTPEAARSVDNGDQLNLEL
ncbi:deoxyribonuclease V [Oculatella sp. LEGE 06141]|uniref:deoxyribonuclease V n=1 Tax=Oculatella sp. LEGE 06141 TaxID=1828648 RepID=UPI0018803A46|nr:deoxyribonuclease V [Oculatella sp. LEGE 06141]MBE9178169.1 deoxyribonuclease V [Oculatella sp. LEGE 06141]